MAFQGDSIYWVEVEKVVPNPFQPRREFDEHKLRELADSIRMYGVLQPLTVTRREVQRDDGTFYTEYELIAGERRLRASKLASISQVPVIIRDGEQTEQEKLELAIIENLQREDLNAVDRALAFKQLAEQFKLSHAQVAQKVGRSREYVSNSIRLLALPENILEALKTGSISEGHARTLLMLNDRPEEQQVVFEEAQLKKLSVRDVEKIARGIATDKVRKKTLGEMDSELLEMEKKFTETLGTRVQIHKTEFGGRVAIDYFTVEDLESILARIKEVEAEQAAEEDAALRKLVSDTPLETTVSNEASEASEAATREGISDNIDESPSERNTIESAATVRPIGAGSEISGTFTTVNNASNSTPTAEEVQVPEPREVALGERLNAADTDKDQDAAPAYPQTTPVELTADTTDQLAQTETVASPETGPETTTESDMSDDDSNLYSIRNFTV